MDETRDRNPSKSEVIGHSGRDEKNDDQAEQTNLKVDKKINKNVY